MVIAVCAWCRLRPAPRRWFRLIAVRRWWIVWRVLRSHGVCRSCRARLRVEHEARVARSVLALIDEAQA